MKNKTLKIACGLLVMVLLTTCVIGTTLARYTTSDTASDTARVAKWGLEVSTSGTLFGNSYKEEIVAVDDATLTVQSLNKADTVVAPGTKNETGFQIRLKGQPEVDYQISAVASQQEDIYLVAGNYGVMVEQFGLNASSNVVGLYTLSGTTYTKVTSGNWNSGTTYYKLLDAVTVNAQYNPIVWTGKLDQNGTEYTSTYTSLTEAANSLVTYINGFADGNTTDGKSNYQSNHAINDTYTLTWSWEFGTAVDTTPDDDDKADTILGNLIAGAGQTNVVYAATGSDGSSYTAISVADNTATAGSTTVANLQVACEITVTATQVD